ncbi:zinc finger protein 700-like isoform X2 [Leguminivora glycinivorella]|uniref:zinc finger protein 700-like isoform X2 n=1 Tax=Leguminivora glycinivorella TaxID=1035111 RepID=UPI0020105B00|nr:zinc finger protein 700-like isoform X2 [Leguminivora glycinivorella]
MCLDVRNVWSPFLQGERFWDIRRYIPRLLKCTRCDHKWDSPNSMRRHCETEHSIPVSAWNCDICTKELTVYGRYLNHLRCHGREYCNQCDKWLFINQMKVHQLTHKDERLFKCSECEKSFKTQLNLTTHIARVHSPEDAMMYCAQCDKQFKNMFSYSYHLRNASGHVPKERLMYKCTQCERQFRIRSQLARHVEAAHSHERRHECQVCREMFKSAKSRRRHVRLVHENYIAPKDKICDYCGKAFRAKKTLSDHINTHTGRRPFVCKLCGADFCHQSALYLHARYKHRIPKKSGRTLKKVAGDKVEA